MSELFTGLGFGGMGYLIVIAPTSYFRGDPVMTERERSVVNNSKKS